MRKIISSAVIIAIIMITGCSSTEPIDVDRYLKKNHSKINLEEDKDISGLKLIKDTIKDKKIIFSGEYHSRQKDDLFRMKLIKYLKEQIGINYYLAELGYSNTYFLNKYLESGDESILIKLFSNLEGAQVYNQDDYDFFKELYEFNNTLKEEDRIKIIGVDIEHNFETSYDYLEAVTKDKNLDIDKYTSLNIENILESLQKIIQYDVNKKIYTKNELINELYTKSDELLKSIDDKKDKYESLFGNDLFGIEIVVQNIKSKCLTERVDNEYESINIREEQIYENFLVQDKILDDAKYFGQWGAFHIYKNPIKYDTIASKLEEDDNYKGKVMSILYNYENEYVNGNEIYLNESENVFKNYLESDDECILINLVNKNSPFKTDYVQPYNEDKGYKNKKYITDYVDCVLIIKNVNKSKKLSL